LKGAITIIKKPSIIDIKWLCKKVMKNTIYHQLAKKYNCPDRYILGVEMEGNEKIREQHDRN